MARGVRNHPIADTPRGLVLGGDAKSLLLRRAAGISSWRKQWQVDPRLHLPRYSARVYWCTYPAEPDGADPIGQGDYAVASITNLIGACAAGCRGDDSSWAHPMRLVCLGTKRWHRPTTRRVTSLFRGDPGSAVIPGPCPTDQPPATDTDFDPPGGFAGKVVPTPLVSRETQLWKTNGHQRRSND